MNLHSFCVFFCLLFFSPVRGKSSLFRYDCNVCQHGGSDVHLDILHVCRRPAPPSPGYISCTYDTTHMKCKGECPSGYKFPDGRNAIEIQCSTNDAVWYPIKSFPNCLPPDYRPHDQPGDQSYDNLDDQAVTLSRCKTPNAPAFGSIRCSFDSGNLICTATCNQGYFFPDGRSERQLQCNLIRAAWYPPGNVPDCVPWNRNVGSENRDSSIHGDSLTRTINRCPRPPSPAPGRISCTYDTSKMVCVGTCDSGYYFQNGRSEMTLQCNTRDAYWYPLEEFPNCVTYDRINRQPTSNDGKDEKNIYAVTLIRCRKPEAPAAGVNYCTYDTVSMNCTGTCATGYSFPNGKREMLLQCRTENGVWYPRRDFPACSRSQIDNERFTDDTQQQQVDDYLAVTLSKCGRKEPPAAGYVNCKYDAFGMNCTGTCAEGYNFPGRRSEIILRCRTQDGYWHPRNEFPSCIRDEGDRYTDESQRQALEVTLNRCGSKEAPAGGRVNCKYDAYGMNCTGTCATGYYFPGEMTAIILQCRTDYGYWYPRNEFPPCSPQDYGTQTIDNKEDENTYTATLVKCKKPIAPEFGVRFCKYNAFSMNCTGSCIAGYYFPNDRKEMLLQCRTANGIWYPRGDFPACSQLDSERNTDSTQREQLSRQLAATLSKCGRKDAPASGYVNCTYDAFGMNCTGTCRTGYYFPGRRAEIILRCRTDNGYWYPRNEFPSCLSYDGDKYIDETQQRPQEVDNQLEATVIKCGRKRAPIAGYVKCEYDTLGMNCTGTCKTGYYFPGRRSKIILRCRTQSGYWYPLSEFPSCTTSERDGYTDESQQQPQEVDNTVQMTLIKCGRRKTPSSGYVDCNYDALGMNCTGTCKTGYYFPGRRTEVILRCRTDTGYWYPRDEFPSCVLHEKESVEESSSQVQVEENRLIQETIIRCGRRSAPENGYVDCTHDASTMNCTGTCKVNHYFPTGLREMVLQCRRVYETWYPQSEFPKCTKFIYDGLEETPNEIEEALKVTLNKCGMRKAPASGYVNCKYDAVGMNCTATCGTDYYFPNGRNQMIIECRTNNGIWYPRSEFPRCLKDNENFEDATLQRPNNEEENSDLAELLRICIRRTNPVSGYVYCKHDAREMNCTGRCRIGYYFPDGGRDMVLRCRKDDGQWYPRREFPVCSQSVANINEDKVEENSVCGNLRSPSHGYISCSHDSTSRNKICVARCKLGYRFPNDELEMTLRCSNEEGKWHPLQRFPDCVYKVKQDNIDDKLTQENLELEDTGDRCRKPNPPLTGYLSCLNYSHALECTGTCMPEYEFSKGITSMTLTCSFASGTWSPRNVFPPCFLKGNSPNIDNDENAGSEDTRNPTSSVLCPKPSTPKGGYIHCEQQFSHGYRRCTGTCMTGFSFPNGENTMVLRCSIVRGWLPVPYFPVCKEIKDRIYHPEPENPTHNQEGDSTGQSVVPENENPHTSDGIYGNRGDIGHDQTGTTRSVCRRPSSPRNGYIYCVPKVDILDCTARCSQGFHFPNGANKLLYRCESRSGRWSPSGHIPDCQSACDVPCNNGGVCVGRNQCFCTQDYRGNFCQYPLSNCDPVSLKFAGSIRCNHTSEETSCVLGCPQRMILEHSYSTFRCNLEGMWSPRVIPRCVEDPRYKEVDRPCPTSHCSSSSLTSYGGLCRRPPPPKPGQIRCIYNQLIMECTSKCADGYRYANGQTEQIRTCDNRTGVWTPSHYMAECQPVCERPCQNGGNCMAPNLCFCPVKYRGKFCQHPLSNCDPHSLRFAGSIRCSHSSEETVCKLGCPEGTVLDNPSLDTIRCSLEGVWTPRYTPRCVEAGVPGRPTYSNQDYHQQYNHALQSNYEQQYRQSQTDEHRLNYEQRTQRQAENLDQYGQIRNSGEDGDGESQRLTKVDERTEDSEETRRKHEDKERFRDSELEKESYEQRLQMKQEEEEKRLYDQILRQSVTNRTDHRQSRNESHLLDRLEKEEKTESETNDDSRRHHFKNYEKFHSDAERFGFKPEGGLPSTSSETHQSGEEAITGYGHRFFRQSINRSESGTYREHSAQQHHYFHQYQRTGHKSTDEHSCLLCTTG